MRLDRWVHHRWPWIPYSSIQKSIRQGLVRLNDRKSHPTARLMAGDTISVRSGWLARFAPPNEGKPLTDRWIERIEQWVVFEDDYVIALNKPAGIASQGGSGQWVSMDALVKQWRPQSLCRLVHRLDVGTSGVLVLAKTLHCAQQLSQAFQEHRVRKMYWAVVMGYVTQKGTITTCLMREGRWMRPSTHPQAQKAVTHYQPVAWSLPDSTLGPATWMALHPRTGRMHQLRVHMQQEGHPIVGDTVYGEPIKGHPTVPMALHCRQMGFTYRDVSYELVAPAPTAFGQPWGSWTQTLPASAALPKVLKDG